MSVAAGGGTRSRVPDELVAAALYASAAIAVVYVAWGTWSPDDVMTSDAAQYLRMADEPLGADTGKPFRFRVLVPLVASVMPVLGGDPAGAAVLRFAVVNVVGLVLMGLALRRIALHHGFSATAGLLVGALPFLCFPVLRHGGVPEVESAAWGVLALAFLLALRRRWVWLTAVLLVGVLVKETTLLAVLLGVLAVATRRDRLLVVASAAPAVVAYTVLRWVVLPTDAGFSYDVSTAVGRFTALLHPDELLRVGAQVGTAFGLLWLVAAWGAWRSRSGSAVPLRLLWAVPVVVAVSVVIHSSYARIAFLAFPVVLLFATQPAAPDELRSTIGRTTPDREGAA